MAIFIDSFLEKIADGKQIADPVTSHSRIWYGVPDGFNGFVMLDCLLPACLFCLLMRWELIDKIDSRSRTSTILKDYILTELCPPICRVQVFRLVYSCPYCTSSSRTCNAGPRPSIERFQCMGMSRPIQLTRLPTRNRRWSGPTCRTMMSCVRQGSQSCGLIAQSR